MNSIDRFIIVSMFVMLLIFAVGECKAAGLRLGLMPSSTHWDSSKDYNERHRGVFLELALPKEGAWAGAMRYENSFERTTNLWYYNQDKPINDWTSWGYMLGAATGYNHDRPILFSAFTFTIHFDKHVKQRTIIIPLVVQAYQVYLEF